MLRWRFLLGLLIIAALVLLFWLDYRSRWPGLWLTPVVGLLILASTQEILDMLAAGGLKPPRWAIYTGNVLLVVSQWAPSGRTVAGRAPWAAEAAEWPLLVLAGSVLLLFFAEMARYRGPGRSVSHLAGGMLALVYVGLMFGFMVRLRMVWGVAGLASLIIVVKMGDTGAYTVGRLLGRHQLSPVISPKKTVEGAIGHFAVAIVASWATFTWLVPALSGVPRPCPLWARLLFGLLVGAAGMFGDLAESLLKREVGVKDSSRWLPGFGGVLDLLDSLLLAAPVAWLLWTTGFVYC